MARRRVWIVPNNLHNAKTWAKGTRTKRVGNFEAEMRLHTSFYWVRPCVHKDFAKAQSTAKLEKANKGALRFVFSEKGAPYYQLLNKNGLSLLKEHG